MGLILDDYYKNEKYKVVVKAQLLNVRDSGSYSGNVIRTTPNGATHIVLEKKDGWGRIGENEWICLDFVEQVEVIKEQKTEKETVKSMPKSEEKVAQKKPIKSSSSKKK